MAIKSVREINFFQTLGDNQLKFTLCNSKFNKTNDEILCFIDSLIKIVQKQSNGKNISDLIPVEEHYFTGLSKKLENGISKKTDVLPLTFIEAVNLHNILDYFENHYDSFIEYAAVQEEFASKFAGFVETPAAFYNVIYDIKNDIEFKLGEMVTHSYKLTHK